MLQILKLRMSDADDGKGIYVKGTLALEYREKERMTALKTCQTTSLLGSTCCYVASRKILLLFIITGLSDQRLW